MKAQNSHKKSIQTHLKRIQMKIGNKPQNNNLNIKRVNQPFIESDAENDSSDLSSQQEQSQNLQSNKIFTGPQRKNLRQVQLFQKNENFRIGEKKPAKFYQILQLPTAQYKKNQRQLDVCSICLQQWQDRETYKILPCKHVLHLNCAKDWLTQKNQCPMCKVTVFYE